MSQRLVSIIMPYYNARRYFAEAIASIKAQHYTPYEILVVDDGSTDDDAHFIRSQDEGIVYLWQENKGPAAARNLGLKKARGDIIAFLDADDVWPAGKLRLQVEKLHSKPYPLIVSGRIQYMWEEGYTDKPIQLDEEGTLHHVHVGALVARKSVFDVVGFFDETLRFSEDHDWWLRVREAKMDIAILNDITLQYRRHEGNMTRDKGIKDFGMLQVLKNSLSRRKALGTPDELPHFTSYRDVKRGR